MMNSLSSGAVGGGDTLPPGHVVRLHFTCEAALPIGSTLRVTSATLWAPMAQDSGPEPTHWVESPGNGMYTSSVELYTTPETYPKWQTRRPVVLVVHKSKQQTVQHHYYRYLVVTPGSTPGEDAEDDRMDEELDDSCSDTADTSKVVAFQPTVATSNQHTGGKSNVMMWEDPFGTFTGKNLCNLPYRTVDIHVGRAEPTVEVMDTWNDSEDVSFRPYLIREAVSRLILIQSYVCVALSLYSLFMVHSRTNTCTHAHAQINEENRKLNNNRLSRGSLFGGSNATSLSSNTSEPMLGTRTPPAFGHEQRIFFVCYHLPVVVVQSPDGTWNASWSESLLAKTEGSQICHQYNAHWVGTVSTHPPMKCEKDREAVKNVLAEMNCTPLFLPHDVMQSHYYGFCKQVLWPAFHNIDFLDLKIQDSSTWDQSLLDNWWTAYKSVNQAFSNTMNEMLKPGDIVWIHDYHLSLLPKLLHEEEVAQFGRSMTRKVFFLHIPFPTSQIFRELDCGEELLEGMLHASVVGFHAFDHARHFLNAAKRILGLQYETLVGGLIGVHFAGRTVMVTMSNVSIEPQMVSAALALPSVEQTRRQLNEKHAGRIIIAGCDIGQRLQGVALKLLAFERLLKGYPPWQSKVVMVQRLLLPGSRKDDEAQTVRELRFLVKRIKHTFGDAVIDYQELQGSSLPMDQRLALWKAADVMMVTPIREGLNHWPMEYIFAHKEPATPGVVIASEFSAVSSILNGALRVNPYDIKMTVTTIDKALTMDRKEREGRRYRDIDFVSTSPSDKWTKNVLRDLKDAMAMQTGSESQSASSSSTPSMIMGAKNILIDSTATYLARESGLAFSRLNHSAVKQAYDSATRRVLILDFNGTIVIKEPPGKYLKREILGTSGNKPLPEVIEALGRLCQDPKNTVYVVSGDSAENVIAAIGSVRGLGLAVSNGAHFSLPTMHGQARQWRIFDLGVDWDAVKRVALPVLSKYTARSNGSFVKLTQFSIGWSYYSCDPEWGSLQASHLVIELERELQAFDVRFVTLKGVVEIVPRKLNKGLFCKKVLRDAAKEGGLDFVLCMGDDISDEKMFTSVFSYVAEIGDEENAPPTPPVVGDVPQPVQNTVIKDPFYCYTVAVGKKPSHASQWVSDAVEVGTLLVELSSVDSNMSEAGERFH